VKIIVKVMNTKGDENYINKVLGGVVDFVRDMQNVAEDEIQDISDLDIEKWLKNCNTDDLLTP
jgi:chemotaxis signal transduction protein